MEGQELFSEVIDKYNSCNSYYNEVEKIWGKYIISYDGRFGILNEEKQIEVPIQWEWRELALLYIYKKIVPEYRMIFYSGVYGLINRKNEIIIPPEWDDIIVVPAEGANLFIVKKNDKYGLVNNFNEVIIPVIWDILKTATHYPENAADHWLLFARMEDCDKKWVIFTREGKKLLERIEEISDRIFLIDESGKKVITDYVLMRRGHSYGCITIGKHNRDYYRIHYSKEDMLEILQCIVYGPVNFGRKRR